MTPRGPKISFSCMFVQILMSLVSFLESLKVFSYAGRIRRIFENSVVVEIQQKPSELSIHPLDFSKSQLTKNDVENEFEVEMRKNVKNLISF
jgi:hypothetical protein